MNDRKLEYSILKTLVYADLFDYPMTFSEILKYLICYQKVSKEELLPFFKNSNALVGKKGRYFFLIDQEENVEERKKRLAVSKKKMKKARVIVRLLSFIPTIKLIGVSGSLSMYNSKPGDDIDFFIITSKNSLWVTRFLVCAILFFLGNLRRKHSDEITDKICPNMFNSFESMAVASDHRNLYMAHEIAQLKVLVNKEYTHERFLLENSWMSVFIANSINTTFLRNKLRKEKSKKSFFSLLFSYSAWVLYWLEGLLFVLQYWYMKKNISSETVERQIAKFHPLDRERIILKLFNEKLYLYKKLLAKRNNTIVNEHGIESSRLMFVPALS